MYFGTPPIVKNGLVSYLDAANYLSFTGSISGSFILNTEVTTFISSSSITFVLSESISESYETTVSESFLFITSSSIIGFTTSSDIIGYITSSSIIGTTTEVTSYDVTADGSSAYIFNGTGSNPTIELIRGTTYTFDINATGHPFWIKTTQTTGTGDSYDDGVSDNGVEVGTITWDVSSSAPSILYYNCQYHSSMVGTFNILDGPFIGQDIISESYEPIISESYEPIISESVSSEISQSIIVITSSFVSASITEVTASFLIPSSSISSSIVPTTASFVDLSGNKNDGYFVNDPLFFKQNGGYFQFNGSSNTVFIPHNSSSLNFSSDVTVSGWVKVNSFTIQKSFMSKFLSGSAGFEFLIKNDRRIYFEGANSSGSFSVGMPTTASVNTWYNVTGVKSGDRVKLYINGILSNETILSGSGNIGNTQKLSLASRSNDTLFFGGIIANFQLYNRALNDSEIIQNYKSLITRYY
jgi:hypothetical protein